MYVPFPSDQGFPTFIEGCKIVLQKGLSQHFQTSHTLTLGSTTSPAQWQFGATYVGSKKLAENDVSTSYPENAYTCDILNWVAMV